MADYSFIANPPQTGGLNSIKDILGIAGAAQSLQSGNLSLQKQRETLLPEIARIQAESRVSQETADPRIRTAGSLADTAATESKQRTFALQREQASAALNEASGLFKDPRVVNNDPVGTIDALVEARKRMIAKGVPEHVAEGLTSELIAKARTPGAVLNQLQGITQANAGPGTQAGVLNAPLSLINNGQQAVAAQLQPGAPGAMPVGSSMQMQLPPTTPTFNQQTNTPGYLGPQTQGAQPPQSGPSMDVAADLPKVTELRSNVNRQAAQVPVQRFNNRQIIDLAPQAFTGTASDRWAKVFSLVDPNWNPRDKSEAANYQKLAHFMALQAQSNSAAMGAGTDAARLMAEQATGNTAWTKEAIVSTAKVNDALSAGLAKFNEGMENAIKKGGNIMAARDFQNQWSRSFDPDVFRYANALEAKDAREIDRILGPKGSPERRQRALDLANKSHQLNLLTGQ